MRPNALTLATLIFIALGSAGCGPAKARVNDPTDLRAYIESANKAKTESGKSEGSLWPGYGYRNRKGSQGIADHGIGQKRFKL
jgi:hypothetical protein